jgi:3-oxoacyl-[acyl-carrier-protein] synthase III
MAQTRFESIGLYLPKNIVSTKSLVARMRNEPTWDLERLTGIKNRRFRSPSECSYSMAMDAAQDCLSHSKYAASDLDVVISTSITRFKGGMKFVMEPAISLFLKNELGAARALNFDISNACAGMLTGAYVLDSLISTGVVKNGMVVSGECISPIAETALEEIEDPKDDQFASLTVGDAGAAFILDESMDDREGIDFVDFVTAADCAHLCIGKPSHRNPGPAMYVNAVQLQNNLLYSLPLLIQKLFADGGRDFSREQYDQIVPHQVSPTSVRRNLSALRSYFNVPIPPPRYVSAAELGNTASTTHMVVLYQALKQAQGGDGPGIATGSRVLFVPFASGQVVGCLSARIGALEVGNGHRD